MTKLFETVLIVNIAGLAPALFMLFVCVLFVPFEPSVLGVALYLVPCLFAYIFGASIALSSRF